MAKDSIIPDSRGFDDDLSVDSREADDPELVDDLEISAEDGKNKKPNGSDDGVVIAKSKIVLINRLLANIKENNEKLIKLLSGLVDQGEEDRISISQLAENDSAENESEDSPGGRIIEGVFDGENMIGPDGKQYSVPANYASKSKLVEGDILKLTITPRGTFVYKQIGPIERSRLIGQLEQSASGNFTVTAEGKKFRVLTASVTYYKGQDGDEAVILIPKTGECKWAAVENIVRNV